MGQFISAAVRFLSTFTSARRQGSLRLTGGDEESAPAAGGLMPSVAQDAGPKPIYIAYVAIPYPSRAAILTVTTRVIGLTGSGKSTVRQPIDLADEPLTICF